MELKELIEIAERAAGSQKALGLLIGQSPSAIRSSKAGIGGLPTYACIQIAKLIGVPEITVIAASELVTEKKAERRAIFAPFVGRAASVLIGGIILLNMSPTTANAAGTGAGHFKVCILCKMCSGIKRRLKQRFLNTFKMSIPKSFSSFFILRVAHMPT